MEGVKVFSLILFVVFCILFKEVEKYLVEFVGMSNNFVKGVFWFI